MLKKLLSVAKNMADDVAIKKTKETLIRAAEENGIEINKLLTPAIEEKFDELLHTILNEHGYAKLAAMGLMTSFKKIRVIERDQQT
ncbi:hypothetical protein [Desulfobacula toluolica]|uniref:Uncharacterized protein n=1 Tax=Desulfobacula toluolica (strain DSM 7467 / Tol2) TaxID=651182 RepID=K0NMB7_DESTT|nr:hypothetical protein [Desulfobacula toluolica]CCK79857.1 uncharacterized protein TOL2_C16960 [Desulfobacula toluolica Tol2]